jgi:hypothetical protein
MERLASTALEAVSQTDELQAGRGVEDLVEDPDITAAGERLRELLGGGGNGGDRSFASEGADPLADPERSGLANLGDAILRKLSDVSRSYREHSVAALKTIEGQASGQPNMKSISELLSLQFQMAEHSLEIEMISKGVSKVVSHVDQLTKLQ